MAILVKKMKGLYLFNNGAKAACDSLFTTQFALHVTWGQGGPRGKDKKEEDENANASGSPTPQAITPGERNYQRMKKRNDERSEH